MSEAERKLGKAAEMLEAVAKPIATFLGFIIPPLFLMTAKAYHVFNKLPTNVAQFLIGACFCFFGGLYPTVFAAVQAAEHGGRKAVVQAVSDLANEITVILEESKKDDKVDADKDGKADVTQIDGKEYIIRKTKLVMAKVDPNKVDAAISSLYKVWLSVIAVLTIQFARVISMALSISDFIKRPVNRFIAPVIQSVIPKEYKRWVPVIIGWIAKAIAMSIAWKIQSVISAFTSALTGGLMMSRAIYNYCSERGITFMGMVPNKHEETYIDEILQYIFAACGFYFQFKLGFDMPFPFSLLLWPLEFSEYYIRWTITKVT